MIRFLFLYPISMLIHVIIALRNKLYDLGCLQIIKSKKIIISIGNIQLGGTGKTPFVAALAQQLIEKNLNPIIISRGYKRLTKDAIIFTNIDKYNARHVGDEPYYLKSLLKTVPIIVDNNKKRAIKTANSFKGVDCILLDDGYQSRYIDKDLDIVLINTWVSDRFFKLMPLGYLREPIHNLNRAHFIYTTKGSQSKHLFKNYKTKHVDIEYQLIKYKNYEIEKNVKIKKCENEHIVAFCGIATSEHFFETLELLKIQVDQKMVFNNHHVYTKKDFSITSQKKIIFITTQKDFVKLDLLESEIYVVDMKININDNFLLQKIKETINENK